MKKTPAQDKTLGIILLIPVAVGLGTVLVSIITKGF
jgi:hypothetical protein